MGAGKQKRVRAWGHIAAIAHVVVVTLGACSGDCPSGSVRVGMLCRVMSSAMAGGQAMTANESDSMQSATGGRAGNMSTAEDSAAGRSGSMSTAQDAAGHAAERMSAGDSARASDAGHGGAGTSEMARGGSGAADDSESSEPRAGSDAPAAPSCMPTNSGSELCDGKDNDCDGKVDEQVKERCWEDADGDGYAAADAKSSESCDMCGEKQTAMDPNGGKLDCDDADAKRSPGATDICGDNLDNDCDGAADNSQKNACGGPCTVQLTGKPGEPCSNQLKGACARMGVYECEGDGTLRCTAPSVQGTPEVCGDGRDNDCDGTPDNGCVMNGCGGWTMLEHAKGSPCSMGDGSCRATGTYECVGNDETACNAKPKRRNSCGGCAVLAHEKDEPCSAGRCGGTGRYVCDGLDATSCNAIAKPPNMCDGCAALTLGAACEAECGAPGRTMCDGKEKTKCVAISAVGRNECGGCSPIPPGQSARNNDLCSMGQGATCATIGTYVCSGVGDARTTVCSAKAPMVVNVCGGCVPLDGVKDAPCVDEQNVPGFLRCDPGGNGWLVCLP